MLNKMNLCFFFFGHYFFSRSFSRFSFRWFSFSILFIFFLLGTRCLCFSTRVVFKCLSTYVQWKEQCNMVNTSASGRRLLEIHDCNMCAVEVIESFNKKITKKNHQIVGSSWRTWKKGTSENEVKKMVKISQQMNWRIEIDAKWEQNLHNVTFFFCF